MATTRTTRAASVTQTPASIKELAGGILDRLLRLVFSVTHTGGRIRFLVFVLGGLVAWIAYTAHLHPLSYWYDVRNALGDAVLFFIRPDPVIALVYGLLYFVIYLGLALIDLIGKMLSADVLRHVIALGVPVFMAVRIATTYLTDIFELDQERIAFRFITQSSFGVRYHRITIVDTKVTPDESPILKIGGPGMVQVNLENVAVFERANGQPHLIGPTVAQRGHAEAISSFERFREAVDLRDQIIQRDSLPIDGRTRDGIRVSAKNIRMIFSVLRNPSSPQSGASTVAANALTYSVWAIWRLVYGRFPEPWPLVMEKLVQRNLVDFIASHNLSEFLAAADVPEFRGTPTPTAPAQSAAAETQADSYPVRTGTETFTFVSRPDITQRFKSQDFKNQADWLGTQLNWIDVGTWATSAPIIPDRHLEAWKISIENQHRIKSYDLQARDNRVDELLIQIRSVPLITFKQARSDKKADAEVQRELLSAYLGLLHNAHDSYQNAGDTPPTDLVGALNFLSDYLKP